MNQNSYRQLIKITNNLYAKHNKSTIWADHIKHEFRSLNDTTDTTGLKSKTTQEESKKAQDLLTYLTAVQRHQEIIAEYFPASTLTREEKLKRTANVVGFNLPKSSESYDYPPETKAKLSQDNI